MARIMSRMDPHIVTWLYREIRRRAQIGRDLFSRGQVADSIKEFLWCAEQGDANSAYRLGWIYSRGLGAGIDLEQAIRWYEKSADDVPSASYNLGLIYRRLAMRHSHHSKTAKRWLRRAARAGLPDAWCRYGEMYLSRGVCGRNDRRAFVMFRRAAMQRSSAGAYRLGVAFARGRGVSRNTDQAISWLRAAAKTGEPRASAELGVLMASDPRFSPEEAAAWCVKAARGGVAFAQYNLGILLIDGRGLPKDLSAARHWFERAARRGYGPAQYNFAVMLADGIGGVKNLSEAWFWARVASENGEDGAEGLLSGWSKLLTQDDIDRTEARAQDWKRTRETEAQS